MLACARAKVEKTGGVGGLEGSARGSGRVRVSEGGGGAREGGEENVLSHTGRREAE